MASDFFLNEKTACDLARMVWDSWFMVDHFERMNEPRRPWLDAERLREKFRVEAAEKHPDVGGTTGDFAELNLAYGILREPALRLGHLLEIGEREASQSGAGIAVDLADLFMSLASVNGAVEDLRKRWVVATTPLARALLAGERAKLRRSLSESLEGLGRAEEQAMGVLRELDLGWEGATSEDWEKLASLQARFAYLSKWTTEVREDHFFLND